MREDPGVRSPSAKASAPAAFAASTLREQPWRALPATAFYTNGSRSDGVVDLAGASGRILVATVGRVLIATATSCLHAANQPPRIDASPAGLSNGLFMAPVAGNVRTIPPRVVMDLGQVRQMAAMNMLML